MSAWTVIAHTELGSAQTSIEFSSIPATYTDLVCVLSTRTANAAIGEVINILFNGSSSNISARLLYGAGSGSPVSSTSTSNMGFTSGADATASTFGNAIIYIPNYAGSTNKSFSADSVSENNATTAYQVLIAGLWSQTTAINSLTFDPGNNANFVQYSSATLYGILKGSSGGVTVS
jgi:hypothetical protein